MKQFLDGSSNCCNPETAPAAAAAPGPMLRF